MGVNENSRAPAVRRAVAVLEFLAHQGSASAAAVGDDLGLAKSSMSDLTNTMLADGLIQKRDNLLAIGPLFADLTSGFVADTDLLDRFAIRWQRQRLLSEHTVSVQAIVGSQSLCVEVRLGMHLLPYTPRAGARTDAWNGAVGEPVLRSLTAADLRRTLSTFAAFSPPVTQETDRKRQAWLDRNARGSQRTSLIAGTGNLELSVALSTPDSAVPPAALTLHLPPRLDGHVPGKLRTALEDFATILTT